VLNVRIFQVISGDDMLVQVSSGYYRLHLFSSG
jgi:hypothetical protein